MSIELNKPALRHARALVREGKVVQDERDDWSEAAAHPRRRERVHRARRLDRVLALASWVSTRARTARRRTAYSFPFGDFRKVHRSGVIAGESRAGQYDHIEIRDALKKLLELIDAE